MSNLYSNSIFWIDVDRIKPNPFQPRREFEEAKLKDLADSIRTYGILQPLTVSRVEKDLDDGGMTTEYELIAGERRLRASKLAGLTQVPVVIRIGDDNMAKLELAIIENLQREDLNAVERARAFQKLADEFKFTHSQIGAKMGKSREYVSNTLRLLALPEEILNGLSAGKISEGHTRPILMLSGRPEEQMVLFKEIVIRKITVREAERIARKIAYDKVRKKEYMPDPEMTEIEEMLQETLGTRVHIQKGDVGGKITIDFFSNDDLKTILDSLKSNENGIKRPDDMMNNYIQMKEEKDKLKNEESETLSEEHKDIESDLENEASFLDDRSKEEVQEAEEDPDLYNLKNFSL
jgi:ParB family transcriptional regulator, chromosome partitioning protein